MSAKATGTNMNNKIIITMLAIILLGGGAYYFAYAQKNNFSQNHSEHTGGKPVDQSHRSYEIEVTQKPKPEEIKLNQSVTLKYKIKNDKGEIIKDFLVAHDKLMHFIIVRRDLMQFQHLHPSFDKMTGEFKTDINFKENGPYRFFADFTPGTDNPMKLPVTVFNDLSVGNISNFQPKEMVVNTNNNVIVAPDYLVQYSFSNNLESQSPVTYSLTIMQDNNPVALEKYLGALGHSVILKEGSLDYIHAHAGEHATSGGHEGHETTPNKIDFTATFPSSGKYKIFTQFQHQGKVITTDYVIDVN
jgi:hypothetical protein